jgi:hypothetical protein
VCGDIFNINCCHRSRVLIIFHFCFFAGCDDADDDDDDDDLQI